MTYRRTYRFNAARTTAVTVVPSSRAFSSAACHTSSGMRIARGVVSATALGPHPQRLAPGLRALDDGCAGNERLRIAAGPVAAEALAGSGVDDPHRSVAPVVDLAADLGVRHGFTVPPVYTPVKGEK